MSIALYEIGAQYREALSWDIESEPDAEALAQLLDEVAGRFEDKARHVVAYLRNVDAEAEAYKAEEDRLKQIRQRLEKRVEGLRKYLEMEMRRCDFSELDAGIAKLKFVKNPWSVEVQDNAELPQEYIKVKIDPDKTKLRAALERGEQIEGVRLVQGERLRIS